MIFFQKTPGMLLSKKCQIPKMILRLLMLMMTISLEEICNVTFPRAVLNYSLISISTGFAKSRWKNGVGPALFPIITSTSMSSTPYMMTKTNPTIPAQTPSKKRKKTLGRKSTMRLRNSNVRLTLSRSSNSSRTTKEESRISSVSTPTTS